MVKDTRQVYAPKVNQSNIIQEESDQVMYKSYKYTNTSTTFISLSIGESRNKSQGKGLSCQSEKLFMTLSKYVNSTQFIDMKIDIL